MGLIGFNKVVVAKVLPFFDLDVDGPTLVRVNRTMTLAGARIFVPTTGGCLTLSAWPYTEIPPGGTGDLAINRAWHGTGPMIFLPFKGRWQVTLSFGLFGTGALLPAIGTAELSLFSMPYELAASYLSAPPASYHASGNFTVGAGVGLNIFAAAGLDLSTQDTQAYWHNLVRLAIRLNTTPVTDFKVALGKTAAAASGAVLGGISTRNFEWQEIAGQTVWVFNNTAGAVDVEVEAHFL